MSLPYIFASNTVSTGAELDANFAALGALTPIIGVLAGTNTLTHTPSTDTPSIAAYALGMVFVGIAVHTNTGAVTLTVGSIGSLSVYKDTEAGPVVLTGGEIVTSNAYGFLYDSALGSGSGGFHLMNYAVPITQQATITFTNTAAHTAQDQNVTVSNAKTGDLVMLGPPVSVIAGVVYMGYVPAAGTVTVRALNGTAASLTPTGGTFRIGVRGAA